MKLLKRLTRLGSITEVSNGRTQSSSELCSNIEMRVIQFKKQGLKPNDRVLLHYGNSIEFFIDLLALWSAGAGAVPLDTRNRLNLATQPQANFEIQEAHGPLVPLSFDSKVEYNGAHLVLYSSGSTASPKTIIHNLAALENKISTFEKIFPNDEFMRSLCILPTHFGHGLIGNSLFPLLTGKHLFIAPAFDFKGIFLLAALVDQYKITFLSSVPSVWRILEGQTGPSLGSLKRIHCASAPFTGDLYDKIIKWAPSAKIFNVYGTTELASWISGYEIRSTADEAYVGSGWDVEFKLTDEDTNGQGRVWARLLKTENNESWQDTSDLGSLDPRKGLKLFGRADDIINNGGLKVHPDVVEKYLLQHSAIVSACVFSLPHSITGESVAAAVVLKNKIQIETHQLENWCRQHLESFQIPTRWFILNDLPINSRGKVSRHSLREFCLAIKENV